MAIIAVQRVLRERLGEDGADALVDLINKANERVKEDVLVFVEEKFERRLAEEMAKVNQRITTEIAGVNQRITTEIAGVNQRISGLRADLIKWMFIFWIGQIGAILGILFAFFKG